MTLSIKSPRLAPGACGYDTRALKYAATTPDGAGAVIAYSAPETKAVFGVDRGVFAIISALGRGGLSYPPLDNPRQVSPEA
jgi:hypothetical protein